MKKITCFLIVLLMLSTVLLPCSATEYLTEEEAGALINKAVEIYDKIHLGPYSGRLDRSDYIETTVSYYSYREGIYHTHNHTFYLVIDESKLPGGSYEALSEYAKSVYTEDIANSMYNTSCFSYYELEQPMFYTSESGKLYMADGIGFDWTEVAPWYYGINKYENQFTVDNIEIVYADSKKATVRYLTCLDRNEAVYYGWVECYLVNTDDGWRITDSPFTKMLRHERYAKELWEPYVIRYEDYKESPSTGDVSGERVAVIGAVTLACIIPAACLMRRRRRRVAVD